MLHALLYSSFAIEASFYACPPVEEQASSSSIDDDAAQASDPKNHNLPK